MIQYSNSQRTWLNILVFLLAYLNVLSCKQDRKIGIEGSGNSNNQVIIADNVENITIQSGSKRLTEIPDDFSETLSVGMNPEIIAEQLGPPKQKSSIDVYYITSNKKLECISWYYSLDDLRIRFDISGDKVIAYTIELNDLPKEKRRIFPVELFCSIIYLGKTTFGEAGEHGDKSFVNQIQFGNFRDWVLLGRYEYPPACSRHSRGTTAYFASTDYELNGFENEQWERDGNGIYSDTQDLSYIDQVITSVTVTGNNVTSNEFGFHFSPNNL